MQSRSLLILALVGFTGLHCAGKKAYLKDTGALSGQKLPAMVVDDVHGARYSTFVFDKEEQAVIFIVKDAEKLKGLKKPAVFSWRIIDIRVKPWYYPGFLYKRKFTQYKKVIVSSDLLEKLKLKPGNYQVKLSRGKITSVTEGL